VVWEGAGSGDRQNAGSLRAIPKNASKVSYAGKRRNGVPTGKNPCQRLFFHGEIRACKYAFMASTLSCPNQNPTPAMSTPDCSSAIAVLCRTTCSDTRGLRPLAAEELALR
jgi:hypothetical protein